MIDFTNPDNLKNIDDATEVTLHKWLKEILVDKEAIITFTKVDGTERVMKCTLEASKLPPVVIKEDKKPRKETTSTKALRVFDLEKQEWRSFTLKNVKSVNF